MKLGMVPAQEDTSLNQIDIITVGEPNEILAAPIAQYEERLAGLTQVRVASIPGGPTKPQPGNPITDEARRVAATVNSIAEERGDRFPIVIGDHYGETLSSTEFAQLACRKPYVCCVVGGLGGLHWLLEDWEINRVSFGRVTLSPSLARLTMLDQLYRALRTNRGAEYDLL